MRMPSKSKGLILCWLLRKSQPQTFMGSHLRFHRSWGAVNEAYREEDPVLGYLWEAGENCGQES